MAREMTERIKVGGLNVAKVLHELVEQEIAPGTGIDPLEFWSKLESLLEVMVPRNRALLAKRDDLQRQIDEAEAAAAAESE